jgi:NAD(P)-dependent dehydrogenase (short-subunit alcohol dehydrogenase family)/putative sterol carrier protein
MKLLDGKVAIVTGAGGGLGRCHALALAAEGARVLVNDPGVARDGTGAGEAMAERVAEEIRKAGGESKADRNSVATTEGAEAVVRAAVEAWGRVDILVNNAGILRDKTIHNLTDEMWDAVVAVHLRGTFACTRAAARIMREKGTGGRIINTTSVAGLKGNFGQSNYSAAKAGIYGFTMTAALEFAKDKVTVNAIAPLAKTRMTEEIESIPAEFRPEDVSPVVVWLASDLSKDVSGKVIGVHGRHLFEYRMESTEGLERKEAWTPPDIDGWWRTPPAAKAAAAPAGDAGAKIGALFGKLATAFDPAKAAGWDSLMHFAIAGAGDWSVEVKGGAVKVGTGVPAAPTCVISLDADTMIGMVEGRVKGDMAFMAGKLKATKVPDLARFGKAFDFRKLRDALGGAPAAATPSKSAPAFDLGAALSRMPGQFLAEKSAGFNGTFVFKVEGQAAALEVKDRACALRPPGTAATCAIQTDGATLAGLLDGTLDASKAVSEGKIKVTHPPAWLKFRQMFRFEPEKGLRRALIGRVYRGPATLVTAGMLAAYDDAVGDSGSPVFPVTLIKEPFTKFFEDPDFTGDLSRMVHGEQVFAIRRPIRALDLVSPRGRVLSIEDKSSGQLLNFGTTIYCEGEPLVEMESRLYFRGEPKGLAAARPAEAPRPAAAATFGLEIPGDFPARYADASGDRNPIHLDEGLAKAAGFKGVIVHGLGTLARVAARLPKPLARLEARFSKPVYPGERLTTQVWTDGVRFEFETRNAAGEAVLANGRGERR